VRPLLQLTPYICLSAAIVSLWLTRGLNRFVTLAAFLTLAIGSGFVAGVLSPTALLPIGAFGALCWTFSLRVTQAMRVPLVIAVVLASLALMAHVVPGFANLLIVKDLMVSRDGVPFTLYLNFDKALIGLFLLAFGPPLIASRTEWLDMLRIALPRIIVVIGVVMICALAFGHVHVDPKWPTFFPLWAGANLLFACTAEEVLFRGVIQRSLQGDVGVGVRGGAGADGTVQRASLTRALTALLIAAILFGAVHFAGGMRSIGMATIAGTGYGWIYWRTGGRIEASILAHFLVNTVHILGFTYPALRW
jgi:uncharacterized protein